MSERMPTPELVPNDLITAKQIEVLRTIPAGKLTPKQQMALTDEQLYAILAKSAVRIRARNGAKGKESNGEVVKEQKSHFVPKLNPGKLPERDLTSKNGITRPNARMLLDDNVRKQADKGVRTVEKPSAAQKWAREKKKQATAGKSWFDLPRTNVTPELKRDLQMLKMRDVLDPHRHYKKDSGKMKVPEYSQVGTIVEGPTEFFTGRIENRKRKRTFVEEVLAGEQETKRFKRKYGEVQGRKTSGKKAFYKEMKGKRRGGVKKGGARG